MENVNSVGIESNELSITANSLERKCKQNDESVAFSRPQTRSNQSVDDIEKSNTKKSNLKSTNEDEHASEMRVIEMIVWKQAEYVAKFRT